jgi:hypothetical protein
VAAAVDAGLPALAQRPPTVAAAAGVLVVAVLRARLVHPVLLPVLARYTLFALHVVARRPRRGVQPAGGNPDGD